MTHVSIDHHSAHQIELPRSSINFLPSHLPLFQRSRQCLTAANTLAATAAAVPIPQHLRQNNAIQQRADRHTHIHDRIAHLLHRRIHTCQTAQCIECTRNERQLARRLLLPITPNLRQPRRRKQRYRQRLQRSQLTRTRHITHSVRKRHVRSRGRPECGVSVGR